MRNGQAMDFEEDIRQHVLANLPHQPSDRGELMAKRASDVLIFYINWLGRFVPARPRAVQCSTALSSNQLATDLRYKPALDQIVAFLRAGTEITAHLSRDINYGYQGTSTAKPKKRRRDLDLLLNDWGVHHLHLSTVIETDGFVRRNGPLLFAVFRPENAYLIDIMNHDDWTREYVIQVMVREWPDAGRVHEIKGEGLSHPLSEQDRKILRSKHVFAAFEIDGKNYMPAAGLTSAGTSIRATLSEATVLRTVRWFEDHMRESPDYIATTLAENGVVPPQNPDFHFEFFPNGGYGIVEKQTGFRFRLKP